VLIVYAEKYIYYIYSNHMSTYSESTSLNNVAAFHSLFDAPVLDAPQLPPADRATLRVSLLQEELNELSQAFQDGDLVEVADALGDLQYVLAGAIHECGLGQRFAEIFSEIHRSNMSKACTSQLEAEQTVEHYQSYKNEDAYIVQKDDLYLVHRKSDNKVLKSINYQPALLAPYLD
jgi:predicted HAD superfamily Cof-like phosphohydrolase